MANEYCPACSAWRSLAEELEVLSRRAESAGPLERALITRNTCFNCGIYWDSDKPETVHRLQSNG